MLTADAGGDRSGTWTRAAREDMKAQTAAERPQPGAVAGHRSPAEGARPARRVARIGGFRSTTRNASRHRAPITASMGTRRRLRGHERKLIVRGGVVAGNARTSRGLLALAVQAVDNSGTRCRDDLRLAYGDVLPAAEFAELSGARVEVAAMRNREHFPRRLVIDLRAEDLVCPAGIPARALLRPSGERQERKLRGFLFAPSSAPLSCGPSASAARSRTSPFIATRACSRRRCPPTQPGLPPKAGPSGRRHAFARLVQLGIRRHATSVGQSLFQLLMAATVATSPPLPPTPRVRRRPRPLSAPPLGPSRRLCTSLRQVIAETRPGKAIPALTRCSQRLSRFQPLAMAIPGRVLGESQDQARYPLGQFETGEIHCTRPPTPETRRDFKEKALTWRWLQQQHLLLPALTLEWLALIDGGVWANNPAGVAAVGQQHVGLVLGRGSPSESRCTADPSMRHLRRGRLVGFLGSQARGGVHDRTSPLARTA